MPLKNLCFLIIAFFSFIITQEYVHAAEVVSIAPSKSMNERVLSVPGDAQRPAILQVTVMTPDGPGPFPLAIMNHGSSGSSRPDLEPRYRYTFSAYYFLSRGYAVVLPMMRGYSGSEGRQVLGGCNQESVGINNAKDISAVIDFMSSQPYIDGNQVVVAGQSLGGWNTLALGTLHHPKIKGLINFSGGAQISNCGDTTGALARAAAYFAVRTSIPSLWFYGDNDAKFAPSVWQAMFDSYTSAGGRAELVAFGRFMTDSHNLLGFPEGLRIWTPRVDAFLTKVGLPSKITHPEYLPADFPQPTDYAAIDDVDAVPYLTDEGRKTYRRFLSDPMPKVFVVSPKGLAASFNGGFDPLGRAMSACQKHSQKCQVYAADGYVTWVRPTPAPMPTNFASFEDSSAVPYLNDAGRQGYQKYLTYRKPKAFVVAPDGAWSASSLGEDPLLAAMESCKKNHQDCRLYAVDDRVVWPISAM
jgi:dienelactone hydrolase